MDEMSQKGKKGFRARVVLVVALAFLACMLNASFVFGQDASSTVSATETLDGTANNAYIDFNGSNLIEDVQNIVNTSKTNYGWLIASPDSEDKGSSQQYQEFRSKEASQSAQRPKLTIVYTVVNQQAAIKSGSSCEEDLLGDTTNYSPNATDIYDGDANFFQDLLCFTDGDGDGFGSGDMMRVKGGDGCGMNLGGASMGYIDVHDNVAKTNGDWDWTKIGRSISQVITDLAVFDIDFGYDQYDDDDKYFQDLLCFDDADGDGYGAGSAKRVKGGNSCDEDLEGGSMDYIAVHDNIAKTDGAWDWSKIGQTVSQVSTSLDSGWGIDFSYDIYDDDDSYFQDLVCFTDADGDGRKGGSAVSTRSGGSCGEDLKGVSRAFLFAGQGVNAGASCASNCDKYDDPSVNPNAASLYEDTICFVDEDGDGFGGGTAVAVASGAGGCGAGANYVAVGEDIDVGDACASGCDIFDDPDLYGTDEGFTPGAYQYLECYTDADGDNYSKIISDPGTTNLVGHWKLEEVPGSCAAGHTDNGDGTCTFQYSIASSADDWLLTDGPSGSNYQQTATEDFRLYKNHLYHTNALARWDTSDIPESATVNSATLTVQIQFFHNQDASRKIIFDWHDWGTGDPTSADFVDDDTLTNALDGPAMDTLVAGQKVFTLTNAGTFVSKTGMTHLRGQLTGSHTGEFSIYMASFGNAAGSPKLTVTYTLDKTVTDSSGKGNTGTIINCNDNIKNYGETGVDCGGSCAVCINRNCKNVYDSGSTTDGVYSINPSGSNAFSVYCDMTSHVGGWTLVATHGTANSVEFASDYGSDLTNPTVNGENLFKGTWADLDFTTAWVQLDNYNDNFYFEGWNTDTLRNELGTIMVTRRTAQSQTQPDCRHFLGSLGNPSSGGTVVSKCGNYVESQTGPISDPAGTGGWCYWNVPQSNYKGSGHCGGGYSPRKGRIWVR